MSALAGKTIELYDAGIKALTDVLGDEDAQAFLKLWRGIPGADFNKWLNEQPQKSPGELKAEIMRLQAARVDVDRYVDTMATAEAVGA
jgi:hypothetical protein